MAAVVAAIETGQMLERVAKALPCRKWEPWVRQTFGTSMSVRTARRLRQLSGTRVARIDSQVSLTEAYRIAGILPEVNHKEVEEDTGLVNVGKVVRTEYVKALERVKALDTRAPLADMDEVDLVAMREELAPVMPMLRAIVGV